MDSITHSKHEISVGNITEISPGVLLLRLPLPFNLDHINVYLLEDTDGWILVDTGLYFKPSTQLLKQALDQVCQTKPLKAVLATHAHVDHLGAAGWICENWGTPLWITQGDYDFASEFLTPERSHETALAELNAFLHRGGIDSALADQMTESLQGFSTLFSPLPELSLELSSQPTLQINGQEWQLMVSNGHTPAHLSLYNRDKEILIAGDQVLGRISSNISVLPDDANADPLRTWLDGLEQLKVLPADTLVLPSHEQPFTGLHIRVNQLIQGYLENANRLERFTHTSKTAFELLENLYPRQLSPFEYHLAYGETLSYINYLMREQRVQIVNPASDVPLYEAVSA